LGGKDFSWDLKKRESLMDRQIMGMELVLIDHRFKTPTNPIEALEGFHRCAEAPYEAFEFS
jgi:hypothetical protein